MDHLEMNVGKKFTMDKFYSQIKVVVPNNIKEVVSVLTRSDIVSNDIVNNFLVLNGKIYVDVVYISEENVIESMATVIDFVERQKFDLGLVDIAVSDKVHAENITFTSSEIVCVACHETEVTGVQKYSVGAFDSQENEFVFSKHEFECMNVVLANEDRFVVAEEVETNLGNINVLSSASNLVISDIAAEVDKIVIDGKVVIDLIYKDDGSICETQKEIEFRQEIAAKGSLPGMKAEAVVRPTNISVVVEQKEDKNYVSYVVDMYAKAYLLENKTIATYDDIFSLKNELVPTYDYIDLKKEDGIKFESDMILKQSDISGIEDFDDLVGVYLPSFDNVTFVDNGETAIVSANLCAVAVYKTMSGFEKLDLCYDVKFETEKDISKTIDRVVTTVMVSNFKIKAGKDLEVSFSVGYKLLFAKHSCEKYVKSFDVKAEKNQDDAAVKVYVLKDDQNLFEVAKVLNVRPEVILEQNEVDDCFEAGQKIYVYNPLNLYANK